MTARITAPVQGLNSVGVGGLRFTDSVAETDNEAIIAYCRSAGYTVEDVEDEPEFPEGDPRDSWTVAQLTAWAGKNDVEVPAGPKPAVVEAVMAKLAERKAEAEAAAKAEADAKAAENAPPADPAK